MRLNAAGPYFGVRFHRERQHQLAEREGNRIFRKYLTESPPRRLDYSARLAALSTSLPERFLNNLAHQFPNGHHRTGF